MTDVLEGIRSLSVPAEFSVRDATARELDVRIMPWGRVIETIDGPETFVRGAFDDTDPTAVHLMGLEHEVHFGLGQDGRPVLTRHPVGRATRLWADDDAQYATFRVARTARGDEVLALAADGIASGVSVEFGPVPGGTSIETRNGRRTKVHRRVRLLGASTTYRPAYAEAGVVAVRSEDEGDTPVSDAATVEVTTQAAPPPPVIDESKLASAMAEAMAPVFARSNEQVLTTLTDRLEKLEERDRKDIRIPAAIEAIEARSKRGDWMQAVLTMLSGQRPNDLQMRALDDLITTENVGVVPDAFSTEIIGIIDARRPFLQTTRRIDLPAAGMSLVVPKIVTRPETGVQSTEKEELASNSTSITTESFDAVTIGGAGDISLQLLRRSSPSFLSLYLELLAESLATNAEIEALQALIAAGPTSGGALDAEALALGDAWVAGANNGLPPDTIWLSTEAVGHFIDAKADGTNMPLYSTIQSGITAGQGATGTISGLRPVHVPALDSASATVDVIVGPSRGFAWTEDGSYTLQVDVPAKAGRDVALVSILWYAPMYPTAFTTYTIAS